MNSTDNTNNLQTT